MNKFLTGFGWIEHVADYYLYLHKICYKCNITITYISIDDIILVFTVEYALYSTRILYFMYHEFINK